MFIGERLRQARGRRHLSQQQLGDLLGVSKVSICGYEKGTRIPNMRNFLKMIEVLEVSPDYLLGRDVKVVADDDTTYAHVLAKEDITILNELKKHKSLYHKLYLDPKRTVELIERKLNK